MTVAHVVIVLTSLLCAACTSPAPEEQMTTSAPVPVVVQTVERGVVEATVAATGVVTPGPGADLVVTAPQAGRIARLPKAQGDFVQPGELLVAFDIPSFAADVAARDGEIAQARARVENATAARTRLEGLFAGGIAARKEVEDADRDLAESQAALKQAQAQRSAAGALASRATVVAPFAGQVMKRWHNPGDLVDASAADPILRVVDIRRLEMLVAVPASAARLVAANQVVRIFLPDATSDAPSCEGRVLSAPGASDPLSGSVSIRASLACQPPALGTPVRVEIVTDVHRDGLVVSASALIRDAAGQFVYVLNAQGQQAMRRAVKVGLVSSRIVEIREGLALGEQVIVRGHDALPDGATVTVSR